MMPAIKAPSGPVALCLSYSVLCRLFRLSLPQPFSLRFQSTDCDLGAETTGVVWTSESRVFSSMDNGHVVTSYVPFLSQSVCRQQCHQATRTLVIADCQTSLQLRDYLSKPDLSLVLILCSPRASSLLQHLHLASYQRHQPCSSSWLVSSIMGSCLDSSSFYERY